MMIFNILHRTFSVVLPDCSSLDFLVNSFGNVFADKIEKISNKKVKRNYQLDKPKGVRGRNSDNTLIRYQLRWEPKFSLYQGLEKTYDWICSEIKKKHNQ